MLTFGLAIHPNICAALTFWFLKRKQSSWSWCQDVMGQLTIQRQLGFVAALLGKRRSSPAAVCVYEWPSVSDTSLSAV